MSRTKPKRSTYVFRFLLTVLLLVVTAAASGVYFLRSGSSSDAKPAITCSVTRGQFVHEVKVNGQVESAANIDVRCEVRSMSSSWVRILEVIEEGTRVEPGDFLIRIDSSPFETELAQEKVLCEQARSQLAQAKNDYDLAQFAEQEYLNGEFFLAKQTAELALFNSEEKLRKATRHLEGSRTLEAQGFITAQQLMADEFALQAAQTEVHLGRVKLDLLATFTKPRRLKQLQSKVVVTEAQFSAAQYRLKRHEDRIAFLEEQIAKCVIRAPVAGQVVLNHMDHSTHWHMIAPGEETMERRVLARLPDPKHMQVEAKIEEDKIGLVRPGLAAIVELEAFPGKELRGEVARISEFPDPDEFLGSAIKKYETTIRIHEPLPGMRPGLTARVRVLLHRQDEQLQVPCQAVFKHGEKDFAILVNGGRWTAQEVAVGPNNGRNVIVHGGLSEGQEVLLGAAAHRDDVALPFVPREKPHSAPLASNP